MIAKGDETYCTNNECKGCWRHESNWEFESNRFYSFIEKCIKNDTKCIKNNKSGTNNV